ncbi:hypothetical protein AQ490_23435 [Wenjunlia vitaminophila]|uniref:Uncharacterized protein n=1 Tax=Wenjunlia vitaminophila TaxID=76728 RepID=A0A0T6LRR9_WENVI|nr:DUF6479 family protein [Wenjunlia vitaminophila]KRV48819.1 hypothetical protein AQ490_23435 [Wenjunlia vitaminophila]
MELTASLVNALAGLGPLIAGVLFVVGLMVARVLWLRRKREEPPVPGRQPRAGAWQTRDELDHEPPPDHGPGHQDGPPPKEYDYSEAPPEEVDHDKRRYPGELGNDYRTSPPK